jgi:DNA-binding MarR family transcriptional regulator
MSHISSASRSQALGEDRIRVQVYLSRKEYDLLSEQAEIRGISRSSFVRQMILERLLGARFVDRLPPTK